MLDVAVAIEACAHELVPGALLGPAVAALLLGPTEHAATLADGAVVGLALGDVVWDAPQATHVLLATPGDAWVLAPRDAVEITVGAPGLDLSRRFGTVRLLDAARAVAVPGLSAEQVRRAAVTLGAAEAAGLARWCLATAVDYAGVREQFGRKIGSFQAIKHLCAEMLEHAEALTSVAWDVANAAQSGDDAQWSYAADVAATVAFDAAVEVAKSCIQVLGGIGFTFEHDAHFYYRRASALRGLLGSGDAAAARLASRAVAGERRRVEVDLDGRDEPLRPEARATAERIAGLAEPERRAALVDSGYLTPHWPTPYGLGADAVQQLVIDQELSRAGVERPDLVIAGWAIPTILEHGTDEQRARFVPPSLLGELVWCQLFSEPGAGSDLASLRTRAEQGGRWLAAHRSEGLDLRRPARRLGHLPGAHRPRRAAAPRHHLLPRRHAQLAGHRDPPAARDDRRRAVQRGVPRRRLRARRLRGRRARRRLAAGPHHARQRAGRDGLEPARQEHRAGRRARAARSRARPSWSRSVARSRWRRSARCSASAPCMRSLAGQGPGPESSVAKLLGVRSRQEGSELVVALQADRLVVPDERLRADLWEMLSTRCLSIAGGTTQILRNVAGERILGLPR